MTFSNLNGCFKSFLAWVKRSPVAPVMLAAFLLYLPLIFLGYGSDYDTYNVLWTGQNFAQTLDYVPSRGPGFFVFETIIFFLNSMGGSLLTNLAVMGMSLVTLYAFLQLCYRFEVPHARLLALALAVHPYYWVNSTCTMDYLFAIGFFFLGVWQILRGRYFTAGVAIALGVGSRLTISIAAGFFLVWIFWVDREHRGQIFKAALVAGVFSLIFYLPPASFAEWTTRFLVPTVGGAEFWTPYLRWGRFVYKNVYFWGPLAFALLAWAGAIALANPRRHLVDPSRGLPLMAAGVILTYELFYLGIPTEPSYLLPTVPFWLVLAGVVFKSRRWALVALMVILMATAFVQVNIARPNQVNQATGAVFGVWLEPGHLAQDVETRLEYMGCGFQPCVTDVK